MTLKKIGRKARLIGLVVALAFSAGILVGAVSPVAQAGPMYEVHTLYYNNAAHSVLVGEKIRFCNGGVYQWGTVTIYTHIYNEGEC